MGLVFHIEIHGEETLAAALQSAGNGSIVQRSHLLG